MLPSSHQKFAIFRALPVELEIAILDHLPLHKDRIPFALLSIEAGHNRIAQLVIENVAPLIANNSALYRKVVKQKAFSGQRRVTLTTQSEKIDTILYSRAAGAGLDRPGVSECAALEIIVSEKTYKDIFKELGRGDGSSFAYLTPGLCGSALARLVKELQDSRIAEEDARYFAPNGKARAILRTLQDLIQDSTQLTNLFRGCTQAAAVDPASLQLGLQRLCSDCLGKELDQHYVALQDLSSYHIRSFGGCLDLDTFTIGNGRSYIRTSDADRLCKLQYGQSYHAFRQIFHSDRLPGDFDEVQTRLTACDGAMVLVQNQLLRASSAIPAVQDDDLSPWGVSPDLVKVLHLVDPKIDALRTWDGFEAAFRAMSDCFINATRAPGSYSWLRWSAADYYHSYLRVNMDSMTTEYLRDRLQIVDISSSMPGSAPATVMLAAMTCTTTRANAICQLIHGCSVSAAYGIAKDTRRKSLTVFLAKAACHQAFATLFPPIIVEATIDLLSLIRSNAPAQQERKQRQQHFEELTQQYLRKYCAQQLEKCPGYLTSIDRVPKYLTSVGAVHLWDECIIGTGFADQVKAWASDKVVTICLPDVLDVALPPPVRTARDLGLSIRSLPLTVGVDHALVCGRISWTAKLSS